MVKLFATNLRKPTFATVDIQTCFNFLLFLLLSGWFLFQFRRTSRHSREFP